MIHAFIIDVIYKANAVIINKIGEIKYAKKSEKNNPK